LEADLAVLIHGDDLLIRNTSEAPEAAAISIACSEAHRHYRSIKSSNNSGVEAYTHATIRHLAGPGPRWRSR